MPKSAKTLDEYAWLKKRLSVVHKFSFKKRKRFTSHQKAAITRAWEKYHEAVEAIENGQALIVKASKRQRKKYPDKIRTNKGFIMFEERPSVKDVTIPEIKEFLEGIKIKEAKVKHGTKQDGLPQTYTVIMHAYTFEIYLPIPKDITTFPKYAADLVKIYNPSSVMLQMNGYHGKTPIPMDDIERYLETLINKVDSSIKNYDSDAMVRDAITGIYLEFKNTKANRRLWRIR